MPGVNWGGIASGIGGLIGGSMVGGYKNPYENDVSQGAKKIGGYGQQAFQIGNDQLNMFNGQQPITSGTVNNAISALSANPYTDAASAGQVSNAITGSNRAYDSSAAQIGNALGASGQAEPGGHSSTLSGALAGNAIARAGSQASIQNDFANRAIQQRYQNLQNAASLATGYQGQLFNYGIGGLQTGANLTQDELQQLLALQQQNQAGQATGASAAGGFGSAIGGIAGMFGI